MAMMSDLSQAEIDALLAGAGGDSNDNSSGGNDSGMLDTDELLSPIEKDALGEIGNISMGSAATTLSTLLGHKVNITTPNVTVAPMNVIQQHYPLPYLVVEVAYTIGIDGSNVFAIQATDAAVIADLMMGGDGTNPDQQLTELHMSAVGEAMNQMMGAVATSLSAMFKKKIDISPPKVNLVDFGTEEVKTELAQNSDEPVVRAAFHMEVDGLIDSEIMQMLTIDVAKAATKSGTRATIGTTATAATSSAATKLSAARLRIWRLSYATKRSNKYACFARAVHASFNGACAN